MSTPLRTPGWFEWITVAAIILGPVLALWFQRILDKFRTESEGRRKIFVTLMRTRATPVSQDHVNALNSIHVIFNRRRDRKIRAAWHDLLEQLIADSRQEDWQGRVDDLRVDLLREIGKIVGFDFKTDFFKREVYLPYYSHTIDYNEFTLRQKLLNILSDDGLKVTIAASPVTEDKPHEQ